MYILTPVSCRNTPDQNFVSELAANSEHSPDGADEQEATQSRSAILQQEFEHKAEILATPGVMAKLWQLFM